MSLVPFHVTEFTWGDTVRVRAGTPSTPRAGELAEVVGIREIENETQARGARRAVGSKLYLIELGDGTSLELPGECLEAAGA